MIPANSVRSILILRYSALGDVVLATSVLDPLRAAFPNARLEWLVDDAYAGLLEGLPALASVHRFNLQKQGETARLLGDLSGKYDLAVDLQNKLRTRVFSFAAAEKSMHFVRRGARESLAWLLGRDRVLNDAHATQLYADVLSPLGIDGPGRTQIALSAAGRAVAEEALSDCPPLPVAIAPGSRWATKRWSPEKFAQLAEALHAQGLPLVLVGGPSDSAVLSQFRQACRAPIAADLSHLSVDGLAAALNRVRLLVSCDSGPAHMAAALGVPVVPLFGPTSHRRWSPPPPNRAVSLDLSCAPCTNHGTDRCPLGHHRCMEELTVEHVFQGVNERLS